MNSMKPTGNEAIDANFQKILADIITATLAASSAASAAAVALEISKRAEASATQASTAAVTASLAVSSILHKGGNWSAPALVWEGFAKSINVSSYGNGIYMVTKTNIDGTPFNQNLVLITPYAIGVSLEVSTGIVNAPEGAYVSKVHKIAG